MLNFYSSIHVPFKINKMRSSLQFIIYKYYDIIIDLIQAYMLLDNKGMNILLSSIQRFWQHNFLPSIFVCEQQCICHSIYNLSF